MDESKNYKTGGWGEAVVVLVFVFLVGIFLLSKFGKDKDVVTNESLPALQQQDLTREEILNQLKQENDSAIYSEYLDKIFSEAKPNSESLSQDYQNALENKVLLPEFNLSITGKIVGNNFNERAQYLNDFENLFESSKRKGIFTENKIIQNQISKEKLIPLSDYDKETLLRIAADYEIWAQAILNLNTPSQYENKSLSAAENAKLISHILNKMVVEPDSQIYTLWIGKYTEIIFDILANRYVK